MSARRSLLAGLFGAAAVGIWMTAVEAQQTPGGGRLPLEPLGNRGEAIFPAFETWGPLKDGRNALLLGYYNRNTDQTIEIPIGPNNRIEPDGPDYGQPTRFEPRRHYGVFAIAVPKNFGNKKLTWTLVANGKTSVVSFWLNPPYWVDFFKHPATNNEPPVARLTANGAEMTGPPVGVATTLTGTVGQPVTLRLFVSDVPQAPGYATPGTAEPARGDRAAGRGGRGAPPAGAAGAPPAGVPPGAAAGGGGRGGGGRGGRGGEGGPQGDVNILWYKHRGPINAAVTFSPERTPIVTKGDPKVIVEGTTQATFSAPGEYWVRAQLNDQSGNGGGGDQCCWTNVLIRVNVK
jgi:hypothetical protein